MTNPTGEQYEIVSGDHRAVITEVGATLRSYTVAGNHVVRGFEADEVIHGGRGQQLLPWPNRVRDGRYVFDGTEQQLALTEPKRHNAIHGLARHVVWSVTEQTEDSLTQQVRIYPQLGWPGTIEASITHTVSDRGLQVSEQQRQYALHIAEAASPKGTLDCITAFGRTDFRGDVAGITVPTLVVHGDSDAVVPFEGSGKRTHEAIAGSELVVVEGGPHGFNVSHAGELNEALIAFLAK